MELDHRVLKLEFQVESHASELLELKGIQSTLQVSLDGIQKTLAQIKWISAGAIFFWLSQSTGLDKVVLKLFSL